MDLSKIVNDVKSGETDRHTQYIDENVKKIKSGSSVPMDVIDSVIEGWALMLNHVTDLVNCGLLKKCISFLRFACSQGPDVQVRILQHVRFQSNLQQTFLIVDEAIHRVTWQLLANLLVQCGSNVEKGCNEILPICMAALLETEQHVDIVAAVIYNLIGSNKLLEPPIDLPWSEIYGSSLRAIYKHQDQHSSFLQYLIEELIVKTTEPKDIYLSLATAERIQLHNYVTEFTKSDVEVELSSGFLRALSENFNRLADRLLTWLNGQCPAVDPKELLTVLECLSTITGQQKYSLAYKSEASLFINSGALLVACCESQKNEVAPKNKLADFETNNPEKDDPPEDPFYDFKTLLIRLIGNLAYKNKKNQDYARDLKILYTVCGCTSLDARNPLIKEWAILAIRNLLENNAENQKLIQQLTSMGKVKSDVLKEFEPEKGFLRLQ